MSQPRLLSCTSETLALIASNLMLIPANLVAGMTFNSAIKQAYNLLIAAQRFQEERAAAVAAGKVEDEPEPVKRSEPIFKRPARVPDICPPARMEQD
jgi:hypothetical protein